MNTLPSRQTSPLLYVCVFAVWGLALALAGDTFLGVIAAARGTSAGLLTVVVFLTWLALMWLIGVWHLANVLFSWLASRAASRDATTLREAEHDPLGEGGYVGRDVSVPNA